MSDAPEYDVIVIGYGYAGGMAAISAADAGARVLLLEKAKFPGGISICSAGGLRIAEDAEQARYYLHATCAGKTRHDVLDALAQGMTGLAASLRRLAAPLGAVVDTRHSPANYPLMGHKTFGFAYVEDIPGFSPETAYPNVRGARQGALLFRVVESNVQRRPSITTRFSARAWRLLRDEGRMTGVRLFDGEEIRAPAIVIASGGFEADPILQEYYWPGGPALSAATLENTGDGIRMAEEAGAALWHMWHWHGCYGYRMPYDYPLGVRVKRLPDWLPDSNGRAPDGLPVMPWILLDRDGSRFMNEYEPYVQDTGARALAEFDPSRQRYPRNPAFLVTDTAGLAMYPLGKPTWNAEMVRYDWSPDNSHEIRKGPFRRADTLERLAWITQAPEQGLADAIDRWNALCSGGEDTDFGRPASSMHPLSPPYYLAKVEPVVSNTQGGPAHDAGQRVLNPFAEPLPGLYAAGECGSAFGHLYMSGGNIAECFIGGEIAGIAAARHAKAARGPIQ